MKIDILGTKVDNLAFKWTLLKIEEFISNGKHQIVTLNPEMVMLAQKDDEFKNIVNKAELVTADGPGLDWAAKYLSLKLKNENKLARWLELIWQAKLSLLSLLFYPKYCRTIIPERITGSDLIWEISKLASDKNYSLFLLGGGEGIAEKAAAVLKRQYLNLKIKGVYPGSPQETINIIKIINGAKPDVLFVAWGHPKQEKWIAQNLADLNTSLVIGVGGAFDHVSGTKTRSPKIFQKLNLEWFWRLITQPWRIGRIFTAVPKFIKEVVQWKWRNT